MKPETESKTASPAVIGVDIGKEIFHLVGLGTDGTIAFRWKIKRVSLKDAFEQPPPCIVGIDVELRRRRDDRWVMPKNILRYSDFT